MRNLKKKNWVADDRIAVGSTLAPGVKQSLSGGVRHKVCKEAKELSFREKDEWLCKGPFKAIRGQRYTRGNQRGRQE